MHSICFQIKVMFTVTRVPPDYARTRTRQNSVRQSEQENNNSNPLFPSPNYGVHRTVVRTEDDKLLQR